MSFYCLLCFAKLNLEMMIAENLQFLDVLIHATIGFMETWKLLLAEDGFCDIPLDWAQILPVRLCFHFVFWRWLIDGQMSCKVELY